MKHLIIFPVLAPLLIVLMCGLLLEVSWTWPAFWKGLKGAYFFGIVPSLAVGGLDWALWRIPFHWLVTAVVGGLICMGLLFLGFFDLYVTLLVGAVPAAICSWLSSVKPTRRFNQ